MSRAAQSWLITQNRLQSGDGGGGCQRLRWDVCRNLREASPRGRPHLAADRVQPANLSVVTETPLPSCSPMGGRGQHVEWKSPATSVSLVRSL